MSRLLITAGQRYVALLPSKLEEEIGRREVLPCLLVSRHKGAGFVRAAGDSATEDVRVFTTFRHRASWARHSADGPLGTFVIPENLNIAI